MEDRIRYWVEMAEYDLETARVMMTGRRFLYVGFMCHQVIEKILKGLYVFQQKRTPPYTHNLSYLAHEIGLDNKLSDDQKDLMDILEPLNVEARYPTYKEQLLRSLSEEKSKEILLKTERLYLWIKQQLSSA
jgi:HEPN domain-containing protein